MSPLNTMGTPRNDRIRGWAAGHQLNRGSARTSSVRYGRRGRAASSRAGRGCWGGGRSASTSSSLMPTWMNWANPSPALVGDADGRVAGVDQPLGGRRQPLEHGVHRQVAGHPQHRLAHRGQGGRRLLGVGSEGPGVGGRGHGHRHPLIGPFSPPKTSPPRATPRADGGRPFGSRSGRRRPRHARGRVAGDPRGRWMTVGDGGLEERGLGRIGHRDGRRRHRRRREWWPRWSPAPGSWVARWPAVVAGAGVVSGASVVSGVVTLVVGAARGAG